MIGPDLAPELSGLMINEAAMHREIEYQRALLLIALGSVVARERIGYVQQLASPGVSHDVCYDAIAMIAGDLDQETLREIAQVLGMPIGEPSGELITPRGTRPQSGAGQPFL